MSETPHPPAHFVEGEIARSTQALTERIQRGGLGAEGNSDVNNRIENITDLVRTSPDRLAADYDKPLQNRTEYDVDRAHLTALAIDKAMTYIARNDARRVARGRKDAGWSRKRERAELTRRQYETMAGGIYDQDPIGAGPNRIKLEKEYRNTRLLRGPEF